MSSAPAVISDDKEAIAGVLVTKCATAWSVISFVLTSSYTAIYAAFALTKDDVYSDFYAWVTKPTCFTAMAVSFALNPTSKNSGYMAFLYFQYTILTLGSEVSEASAFSSYPSVPILRL